MGQSDNAKELGKPSHKWKSHHRAISWAAAGTETLHDVITRLTENGCGVMFSRTTDGGSLVLGIYAGNERSKEYVTEPGDIISLLAWAVETYG